LWRRGKLNDFVPLAGGLQIAEFVTLKLYRTNFVSEARSCGICLLRLLFYLSR